MDRTLPHGMWLQPVSGDQTREAYWGEFMTFLEAEIRPGFRAHYESVVHPELFNALGREPDRYEIAAKMMEYEPNHAWYVVRTDAQRLAFDVSRSIVESQDDELTQRAASLDNGPAKLELDASLPFPDYIQSDAHNMEGGYADEGREHPLAAGAIYDRALATHRVNAMGPLVDDTGRSVAAKLKEEFPDFQPLRILEIGCTVGHMLLPFKEAFPDAEVIGIDVSEPCVAFGAARASSLGVDVTFSQRNAENTGYEAENFDLIFSRMLLHETCEEATRNIFAECHRLLRPGGIMFHSDAPQFDQLDTYTQSLRDWDTRFNAEPFMDGYYRMALEEEFERSGFASGNTFHFFAPSLIVQRGYRAAETRSGGRYFFAGAIK